VDLPARSFDLARPGVAPPLVVTTKQRVSIERIPKPISVQHALKYVLLVLLLVPAISVSLLQRQVPTGTRGRYQSV